MDLAERLEGTPFARVPARPGMGLPPTGRWQALDADTLAQVPLALHPWLTLATSMTQRLRESLRSDIRVQVLRSEPGALLADERGFFGGLDGGAHVREVCLHGAGRPVLAARTVYRSDRLARDPALASLGERPLGDLLFEGPAPARWSHREVARLDADSPPHPLLTQCLPGLPLPCWGRRTLFWLRDEPLLVTEVLLPVLLPPAA